MSLRKKRYREISARVTAFLFNLNNNFLLLKLPTGYGKTTNTLKTINENFGDIRWIYLAPFHHNIIENLEMSPYSQYEYIHLMSRAKTCIITKYRELAEKHIDIRPICENRCPRMEEGCPYYEAKNSLLEEPQNWAGVHHHINDFLADFLLSNDEDGNMRGEYYDLLIIDENPISVLFINERINDEKLEDLKDLTIRLNINNPQVKTVESFLDFLIDSFTGKKKLDYDELYRYLDEINFDGFYDDYQIELLEAVIAERVDIKEIPKDYYRWFGKIKRYMDREKLEKMFVKKPASGYTQKHYYLMCFEEEALQGLPLKIIGLDGTANIEIWETLLGTEASIFSRKYDYTNMYQLTDGEYPLSSWLHPYSYNLRSTGERLCKLIDLIAEKKKYRVLVICTKALEGHIRRNTKTDKLIFGNYYYLRSRNDFYKDADTVILAVQPNIPEFQIDNFADITDWGRDIWRAIFTDEEMMQGIGRIRQDMKVVSETMRVREEREIYIFPSPRTEQWPDKHVVDIFGDWAEKMSYNQMIHWLKHKILPQDRAKKEILKKIPEKGIYQGELFKLFSKDNKNYSSIKFRRILIEMKQEELIKYVEGKKRRRIYKRVVEETKK